VASLFPLAWLSIYLGCLHVVSLSFCSFLIDRERKRHASTADTALKRILSACTSIVWLHHSPALLCYLVCRIVCAARCLSSGLARGREGVSAGQSGVLVQEGALHLVSVSCAARARAFRPVSDLFPLCLHVWASMFDVSLT
jgi:hypothetical protein